MGYFGTAAGPLRILLSHIVLHLAVVFDNNNRNFLLTNGARVDNQHRQWRVLGIESSCDETGVAVYDSAQGLMAEALFSQVSLHAEYGGVVPELASRDHVRKLIPLIDEVLTKAAVSKSMLSGVAYTAGPGLLGALLVGAAVGRSLAWSLGIPSVAVHHMEGHLLAPMLEANPPRYPFLALLVSGGHTMLIEVSGLGQYQVLGESVDDAVGEAFDKTAKLLGLGYPGGAALERLARSGSAGRFEFPRPMTDRPGLDFSFSGLKTRALTTWRDGERDDSLRADIALAFQQAVVDTLVIKCRRALQQTGLRSLVIAGGVGANQALRQQMQQLAAEQGCSVHYPRPEFCTDNGAMIAYAGCQRLMAGEYDGPGFTGRARWPLDQVSRPPG